MIGWTVVLVGCVSKGDWTEERKSDRKHAFGLNCEDRYTLVGATDFLRDIAPTNLNGTLNVVVEIPTGTTEKWEVNKILGGLSWELEEGRPRMVQYSITAYRERLDRSVLPGER